MCAPAAVFTQPQIASVGATEQDCRDRGLDYVVGLAGYGNVAYGSAMEDTTGFCKVLAEPGTGRPLGAHLMGAEASTLIQPFTDELDGPMYDKPATIGRRPGEGGSPILEQLLRRAPRVDTGRRSTGPPGRVSSRQRWPRSLVRRRCTWERLRGSAAARRTDAAALRP
ncbi:hypothetical protein [Streptomyces sp. NPDC052494]|uniref:hypothetical protein n=1 Tax=Streptomyces sp. NPDC052494 TaxID=3365692 RepID=UPI0037D7D405